MTTTLATMEDLQLSLFVEGPQWEGLFDSLEVFRSRVSAAGPYEPLTGPKWMGARIPANAPDAPRAPATGPSVTIVGTTLSLRVDESTDLSIVFTGVDPLTYAQCAAQITAQGVQLVTSYVVGNLLVLETTQPGNGAILRVVGGDAAAILGLATVEPGSVAFGLDARIPLAHEQQIYPFVDHNGDPSFFYKTRFFSSSLNTFSPFSPPFTVTAVAGLDESSTIRATIDLVDSKGVALANRSILLHPKNRGTRIEGKVVIDSDTEVQTDESGHAEFMLVRGQSFTVAIAGTDIVRDFTAPIDPTLNTFDMLDPSISSDDNFTVQHPSIDYAVRRSL